MARMMFLSQCEESRCVHETTNKEICRELFTATSSTVSPYFCSLFYDALSVTTLYSIGDRVTSKDDE
jgi:hypothetical protein